MLTTVAGMARAASHTAGRRLRSVRRRILDRRAIDRYVRSHPVVKLQHGAGPNVLSGWLNTDLVPDAYPEHRSQIFLLDAVKPFPVADMSVDYIFSEQHQIE